MHILDDRIRVINKHQHFISYGNFNPVFEIISTIFCVRVSDFVQLL